MKYLNILLFALVMVFSSSIIRSQTPENDSQNNGLTKFYDSLVNDENRLMTNECTVIKSTDTILNDACTKIFYIDIIINHWKIF